MANETPLKTSPISGFNTDNLEWMHLEGGPKSDYPINYWLAVLGARPEEGCVDFLGKWEPGAYCLFSSASRRYHIVCS